MDEILESVYKKGKNIFTRNEVDGTIYYDEKIQKIKGFFYRQWNPYKSKVGAAIIKGLKELPITDQSTILYLGSSTGTTVSHLSDILTKGKIFALDISREMIVLMMKLVNNRDNVYPILSSASEIENYSELKEEEIDLLIQDIACREQVDILTKNADGYLKSGAHILLALKTQCIDSVKKPSLVMEEQKLILKEKFKIKQTINLEPYEKNHWLLHMEVL